MQSERNAFIACDGEFDRSKIVIFGAPFDSTTSYRPGTRFGAKAIRQESYGMKPIRPIRTKTSPTIHTMTQGTSSFA